MRTKKITHIVSNINYAIAFEWIAKYINKEKYELSFIFLHPTIPEIHQKILALGCKCYYIEFNGKKSYPLTFLKVIKLLIKIKPEITHSHLFDANLIGLTVSRLMGIKKRIYSRHHSTFHHDNFPKAVKYDNWANNMATHIIAISENVKGILNVKENVINEKISLIHYGFDLSLFEVSNSDDVSFLMSKYNMSKKDSPIIGVVSRYIKWKGVQYIIPAFKKILNEYPNAKLILANANGPDREYIHSQLAILPKDSYVEISFEKNLFALYKLFDVFIHVPINKEIEAFGQTYVEALAAGTPSVFTLSGIASEFVQNKNNALVVDYKNSEQIHDSIIQILANKKLTEKLIENGRKSIDQFRLEIFIKKLEQLYV